MLEVIRLLLIGAVPSLFTASLTCEDIEKKRLLLTFALGFVALLFILCLFE